LDLGLVILVYRFDHNELISFLSILGLAERLEYGMLALSPVLRQDVLGFEDE